ncbi:MAG: putative Bug-like extra-cytoplasmic solute receptor, family [Betaproteobacteria bacterium]|jgi:tripartite-type tricarboxylate transporter receptor subunit TctC|nr:putative Bug-like extra-cytoplasmic solute receptor, family [Betaproteobacteria bacterium]
MKAIFKLLLCAMGTGCGVFTFGETLSAAEAPYPNKPIRLIVASSPGGPNDLVARMVAAPWGELLGRPIVIDNRAGAAGVIGSELVARAAPDGYTLLVGFPGPLIIAPLLNETAPYDTLKDFAPVSLAVSAPFVLLVHPGVPAKSVKELVALARARPGKMNYASGGTGIGSHLAMELLNHVTGTQMVHVPYKGAGPGLTALMAAEVDAMFVALGSVLPHIKTEKVRALALGGEKRYPLLPNLPTISESGYRFNSSSWYGILAPRNTPRTVIGRLHGTLTQTLEAPQMRTRLTDMAFETIGSTPDEFAKLIREETATWRKVISAAGLKAK